MDPLKNQSSYYLNYYVSDISKSIDKSANNIYVAISNSSGMLTKTLNGVLFSGVWYHFSGDYSIPFYLISKLTIQSNPGISSFSNLLYWSIIAKHFTTMVSGLFFPKILLKYKEYIKNYTQIQTPSDTEIQEDIKMCAQESSRAVYKLCMIGFATLYIK